MHTYWKSILLALTLTVSIIVPAAPASAAPTIIPSHWNGSCIDYIYNPVSMDDYTWKTLAGEMYDFFGMASLKAFADVIRSDAYNHRSTVETALCLNPGGYKGGSPNINTAEQNYLDSAVATSWPNSYKAVTTYTPGEALDPDRWYFYSTCQQSIAADLAAQGWDYRAIITDQSQGIFSTSQVNYCKTQPSGTSLIVPYSGMSFLKRW